MASAADSWVSYPRWARVTSSNVLAIYYDYRTLTLSVQFKGTAKGIKYPIYKYQPVTDVMAKAMFNSGSKGKFVWGYLRNGGYTVIGPL